MGETLAGRWTFRRLMETGAARIIMFDIGWVGGLSEASAIAALAESYELPVAPHDCTGPVVLTASTHLATSVPNALVQETVRAYYLGWYGDVVTALPTITDGRIAPPPGPGLGTALRPELLARPDALIRRTAEGAHLPCAQGDNFAHELVAVAATGVVM